MAKVVPNQPPEGKPARISYLLRRGTLLLVRCLHQAIPLLLAFFGYLALTRILAFPVEVTRRYRRVGLAALR